MKTNPPLPHPPILSTEIKEFFSRPLFTFKCLSLYEVNKYTFKKKKKVWLVSLMIKWFFGLTYFVLSINNITLLIWNILIQYRFLFLQFFFTHIVLVQRMLQPTVINTVISYPGDFVHCSKWNFCFHLWKGVGLGSTMQATGEHYRVAG